MIITNKCNYYKEMFRFKGFIGKQELKLEVFNKEVKRKNIKKICTNSNAVLYKNFEKIQKTGKN